MTALYAIPSWLLLILAIVVFAAFGCAALWAIRRVFPDVDFIEHNGIIAPFTGISGSLFAVTVAFIIAIVWQEYDGTQQRVATEVAAAKDLWHVAAGLPQPLQSRVRTTLFDYAKLMVHSEWPAMRAGGDSRPAEVELAAVYEDVVRFRPAQPGESTVQSAAIADFNQIRTTRQSRINDNRRGIGGFEWATLLFGSVIVIGLCCMVGLQNLRAHYILTAAVVAMIAATFVLIFELDYPFRGDLSVAPTGWQEFLDANR